MSGGGPSSGVAGRGGGAGAGAGAGAGEGPGAPVIGSIARYSSRYLLSSFFAQSILNISDHAGMSSTTIY